MNLQSDPTFLSELHPFPVFKTSRVLRAEFDPQGLRWSALRGGKVGLELDSVRSCVCNCFDEAMRLPQASLMSLTYLGHYES